MIEAFYVSMRGGAWEALDAITPLVYTPPKRRNDAIHYCSSRNPVAVDKRFIQVLATSRVVHTYAMITALPTVILSMLLAPPAGGEFLQHILW